MKTIIIMLALLSFSILSADLVTEQDNFSSMPDLDAESNQEPATDSRPENLRVTNTWNGSSSTNWLTPANWSLNRIPLSTDDVGIPVVSSNRYPSILGTGVCNYLNVANGASLTMPSNGKINVTTHVNIHGELTMNSYAKLTMDGGLLFRDTAVANFSGYASIYVGTYVTFMNGSDVNIPNTELELIGTYVSSIQTNAPTVIGTLRTNKPGSGSTNISAQSTATLSVRYIHVSGSNKMYHYYTGTTIVRESLWFDSTSTVRFSTGTLSMEGATYGIITDTNPSNNYLNNLEINKTGVANVTMATNLNVKGTFNIQTGIFKAASYTLQVGGEWSNSVGTSGFFSGTGTVVFNQATGIQTVSGENIFYNVQDNHPAVSVYFIGYTQIYSLLTVSSHFDFRAGGSIAAVSNIPIDARLTFYDNHTYTIDSYTGGGSMTAYGTAHVNIAAITDNAFYGNFTADNAHLEFHRGPGELLDLNGGMAIVNNGIVDIYGGSGDFYIAYSAGAVFLMNSGSFNVKDNGIFLVDRGYPCIVDVSGGTITVNGDWYDSWGIFKPTGGSVVMAGTEDNVLSPNLSGWFWNLKVNKAAARESSEPQFSYDREGNQTRITRSSNLEIYAVTLKGGLDIQAANIVTLHGPMNSTNSGTINIENASFHLNGNNITSTGDLNINANGKLRLESGSHLLMGNSRNITVNNGGNLLVLSSLITRSGTLYYGLNVESGGTVGAESSTFEYVNADGITLKAGSWVNLDHPFDFCTFHRGAPYGRLLTINNSLSFIVNGANFPTNTWIGSQNVVKTVDSGMVYFENWTGTFGGPAYEQDGYNRVYWQGHDGVPPIADLTISYISATSRVQLNWSYPLTVINYKIYRSLDPDATFVYHATSANNTWSELVPGPKYFYKVTAVTP